MSFNIIVTSAFKRHVKNLSKKYKSLKNDLSVLVEVLEINPQSGIPIGKDCYKIRFAITSKGQGKSGGARVITCVKIINNEVYMLALYDKSEKETITDKELDELLKISGL
jgi:hypothetical protein